MATLWNWSIQQKTIGMLTFDKTCTQLLTESEDSSFLPIIWKPLSLVCTALQRNLKILIGKPSADIYEVLLKVYPNPFAEINYAVALQYNHQDEKALSILMNFTVTPILINWRFLIRLSESIMNAPALVRIRSNNAELSQRTFYFQKK